MVTASEWFQNKLKELENTDQFKAETIALACEETISSIESENAKLRAEIEVFKNKCREANDALSTIQGLSWEKLTNTERGKIKRAIAILHGKVYHK